MKINFLFNNWDKNRKKIKFGSIFDVIIFKISFKWSLNKY